MARAAASSSASETQSRDGGSGGAGCRVKILRRGKTGGVLDFCGCDCCGGGFKAGGAGGESRRVMNGGVGTLGGVADRLGVGMGVEASDVEASSGSNVFDFFGGARGFQWAFLFGGKGGGKSTASISIMVGGSVGMVVFIVTIGGSGAV